MNELGHILVLDDDPDICSMIKLMLEYHHYAAFTADSEQKAHQVLDEEQIDLIIMDMLLSGVDGRDVCKKLKQDQKTAHIPVLMFSAHPNACASCIEAGADDFIAKPFEMDEMLKKIKALRTTAHS